MEPDLAKPGDPIRADQWNRLRAAALRRAQARSLVRGAAQDSLRFPPPEVAEVVQLTTTLSMGGSAKARVLYFDGSAWKQTAQELTVHDVVGSMEGTPGKRGLAWFHRQSGLWILWQLEC